MAFLLIFWEDPLWGRKTSYEGSSVVIKKRSRTARFPISFSNSGSFCIVWLQASFFISKTLLGKQVKGFSFSHFLKKRGPLKNRDTDTEHAIRTADARRRNCVRLSLFTQIECPICCCQVTCCLWHI